MYIFTINIFFFLEEHILTITDVKSRPGMINLYAAANKHNLWLKHFFSRIETQAPIIEAHWDYSDGHTL